MSKEKSMFDDFKKNVLSNKPKTKRQKVIQDSDSILKEEEPFTFWLPKSKMKALKIRSIESGSSLKALLNEAIDMLLKKDKK